MKSAVPASIGGSVWVTKYALTQGIRECRLLNIIEEKYVSVSWKGALNGRMFLNRKDVSWTLDEAIELAEQMRTAKLASLQKQVDKLTKKKIKVLGV
jgi:hypothetical protein